MPDRPTLAKQCFCTGYTCCQAVLTAVEDLLPLDHATLMRLAAPFGGGMAGTRQTCGAVTAMGMAMGLAFGDESPLPQPAKAALYAAVRTPAEQFAQRFGSMRCAELLAGLPGRLQAEPALRDDAYYRVRPCAMFVEEATRLLQACLTENAAE